MTRRKPIQTTLLALLICLLWFELTPADLWIQQLFFDVTSRQWLWSGSEPISRLLLYDGLKKLLIVFAVMLLASLFFAKRSALIGQYRRGIVIVLLSLILVPLCVVTLKALTNVACPKALTEFDGSVPYTGVLERYPPDRRPARRQHCFPAGHASGGFALLSLFFLFKTRRNRHRALYFAVTLGGLMSGYKMLIGDHFLSHSIITMLLAWLIINLIVVAESAYFSAGNAHRKKSSAVPDAVL